MEGHFSVHDAAEAGNILCLKYAHEHGCPWDATTCANAAGGGNILCLKYAHEHGCPWDEKTCSYAAEGGHLDCLEYAHNHGCPWDATTCANAAVGGHLGCLKYAHEHGCPWDVWTCSFAAGGGYLNCLEYAHEHGCPWDMWTCSFAASKGHLDCLKYAHEHGCPWDAWTPASAAGKGHLDCLKYAHDQGCPWYARFYARVALFAMNNNPCFAYMLCHGCDVTKPGLIDRTDALPRCSDLDIALILYVAGASCLSEDARLAPAVKRAEAIIDKLRLLRRMKEAYVNAAATRIQRTWKQCMYRPGGAGMLRAHKRFRSMTEENK